MKDNIQSFGYSEMYEWQCVPHGTPRFGRFVQFDEHYPNMIKLYTGADYILGVTSANSTIDSDNPEEWHDKFYANEYGDLYLRKEKLAVGEKKYDQIKEISYIETRPWTHYIPIENSDFDSKKEYIKRSMRSEWVRVNLLGKCIVEDNGKCVPGQYCKPFASKFKDEAGIAVPSEDENDKHRYYILSRISKNTIMIVNK